MPRLYDHVLLVSFVCILCGPVVWLLAQAIGPDTMDTVESLAKVGPGLSSMAWLSLALAAATALLSTSLSFLTAYALVFCAPRFAALWFWLTVTTLYFPIEARMLHTFDVAAALGLTSTFAGLVLPVLQLALGTLFFRQHFKTFPPELMEAARLDGAGPIRFLIDFGVPLSLLPIGIVVFVTFTWGWNQYLWPLMVSVDDRHWTLVRGLEQVRSGSPRGLTLAALSMLPPLALVLILRGSLMRIGTARV